MTLEIPENVDISQLPDEYLEKVISFARKVNKLENLSENIDRLATIANNRKVKVLLTKDSAPYSFLFSIPGGFWGGLIFHSPHDGGGNGDSPTFSVNLNPEDGWSIFTPNFRSYEIK